MIRKLLFLFLGILFWLNTGSSLWAQVETDSTPIDTTTTIYDETVEEESDEAEEEEEIDEDSLQRKRYNDLIAAVTDTHFVVAKVPEGKFGNEELAEKQAQSFDFTENVPRKKKETKTEEKKPESSFDLLRLLPVLKYILIAFLVLILAYLVFRMVSTASKTEKISQEMLISWETDPDKIAYGQLEAWLKSALEEKNFAYAVRVLFLMVLKEYSKREIILWKRNKTNRDYLYEIRQPELARPFRIMAAAFDASRYGNYKVDQRSFEHIQAQFSQIKSILAPQMPA